MADEIQNPQLSKRLVPKTAKTARGVVEYAEFGSGPAVVCLHGAMGGCDQSLLLAQTIGDAGYRYLCVSRPGYLGTALAAGRSPEQQADLVAALLDALGIAKAGVMAVSGGGPCAIYFGLRHPDLCKGLVLVSTVATRVENKIPVSFKVMMRLARWPWFVGRLRRKAESDLEGIAKRSIRDPRILAATISDKDAWPLFSALLLSTYDRMGERIDGTINEFGNKGVTSLTLTRKIKKRPPMRFQVHQPLFSP